MSPYVLLRKIQYSQIYRHPNPFYKSKNGYREFFKSGIFVAKANFGPNIPSITWALWRAPPRETRAPPRDYSGAPARANPFWSHNGLRPTMRALTISLTRPIWDPDRHLPTTPLQGVLGGSLGSLGGAHKGALVILRSSWMKNTFWKKTTLLDIFI